MKRNYEDLELEIVEIKLSEDILGSSIIVESTVPDYTQAYSENTELIDESIDWGDE